MGDAITPFVAPAYVLEKQFMEYKYAKNTTHLI